MQEKDAISINYFEAPENVCEMNHTVARVMNLESANEAQYILGDCLISYPHGRSIYVFGDSGDVNFCFHLPILLCQGRCKRRPEVGKDTS